MQELVQHFVYVRPPSRPQLRYYLTISFQNYKRADTHGRVQPSHGTVAISAPKFTHLGRFKVREEEWKMESAPVFTSGLKGPLKERELSDFTNFIDAKARAALIAEACK